MTPFLTAARDGILCWVTLSLIPVEIVFDAIEAEIERHATISPPTGHTPSRDAV